LHLAKRNNTCVSIDTTKEVRTNTGKALPIAPKPNRGDASKGHTRQPSDTLPRMVQPVSSIMSQDYLNQSFTSLPRQASATSISSIGPTRHRQQQQASNENLARADIASPPPPAAHIVKPLHSYINTPPRPPPSRP